MFLLDIETETRIQELLQSYRTVPTDNPPKLDQALENLRKRIRALMEQEYRAGRDAAAGPVPALPRFGDVDGVVDRELAANPSRSIPERSGT